jgi:hypothetical protein
MQQARTNFVEDIERSIKEHFSFLVDAGFRLLPLKQAGREFNIEYQKDNIWLDFSFEFIPSTSIGASINKYPLHALDLSDETLRELNKKREALYANSWKAYLRDGDAHNLDELSRIYAAGGDAINDAYISELACLLKKHHSVLLGDFRDIARNTEEIRSRSKNELNAQIKRNKMYRCTYACFAGECEFESSSLSEIRRHLETLANEMPISDVVITDWNGVRVT